MSAKNASSNRFDDVPLNEFVKRQYETVYSIDPILPALGTGIVHGKAGHGKSQWTFSLIDAISSGGTFLNRYKTAEGKVLYVQADMPENLFNERLQKAFRSFTAPENIIIAQTSVFNIFDPKTQDELATLAAKYAPDFVAVDTLRKTHQEEENDSMTASLVYAAWHELFDAASIFFQHHDRKSLFVPKGAKKDDGSGDDTEAFAETFRGTRAWVDDADLGVHLYKFANQNKIKMSWSKWRCEPQPTMTLRMDPETLLVEPAEPRTAKEWAYALSTQGLDTKSWAEEVMAKAGVKKSIAYRVVGEIMEERESA